MKHKKIIKYNKSHFKNTLDENIKFHEQITKNNYIKHIVNIQKKQYTLKNPIIHERYIINSIEDLNRQISSESREYAQEIHQIIPCKLSLDNNYFNSKIDIDDIRIIPIRIEKVTTDNNVHSDDDDDDDDDQHTIDNSNKMNIISIEINNYCRYILCETIDNIQ